MKWIVVCALLAIAGWPPIAWLGLPASSAQAVFAEQRPGSLLELLPESTLIAVEIRDADRRWSELRAIRAVATFQNRLLDRSGLEPDDLPLLTGNRAVLALIRVPGTRSVIPVAVLRPTDLDRAEAILDVRADARKGGGAAWYRVRARTALWVGPASAAGDLDAIARGHDTGLNPLHLSVSAAAAGRLPEGGLVRGWVNPSATRDFLRDLPPGTRPATVELISAVVAAELDAVRWIGFRRDVIDGRLVTDAVVTVELSKLPAPVARIFDPGAPSAVLPSNLPEDVAYVGAFRPEPAACLPWLRFLERSDSRGPFRNLGFWIEEFEERSGLSIEQDLFGALGEHAWEILLESRAAESIQWAAVIESTAPARVEATLLALRDWLADQARSRSFGLARLTPWEFHHHGERFHGSRIGTLLGDLPGPAFAATEEHIVLGVGDRALSAALDLVASRSLSDGREPQGGPPVHAQARLRGPALARTLEQLVGADSDAVASVIGLLHHIGEVSIRVSYEPDGLRIHGEVGFSP